MKEASECSKSGENHAKCRSSLEVELSDTPQEKQVEDVAIEVKLQEERQEYVQPN